MTTEPKNEKVICEAVMDHLSRQAGAPSEVLDQPDKTDRTRQRVELVFQIDTAIYVLEHTRIESFTRQIADGKAFSDLLIELEGTLPPFLPPGTYELIVPVGATSNVRGNRVLAVRDALAKWIVSTAPTLKLGPDDDEREDDPWSISREPPGVGFEVTLQRSPPDESTILFVARFAPEDLESRRLQRVRAALDRKLPKLRYAKDEWNAQSVIVLESDDIALANHTIIAESVEAALAGRDDVPDYIFLVETDRGLQWRLWLLRAGEKVLGRGKDAGPHTLNVST